MGRVFLKSYCLTSDCSWLLYIGIPFSLLLSIVAIYFLRKHYKNYIQNKKPYNEKTNPNGYVLNDYLIVIWYGFCALFFVASLIILIVINTN